MHPSWRENAPWRNCLEPTAARSSYLFPSKKKERKCKSAREHNFGNIRPNCSCHSKKYKKKKKNLLAELPLNSHKTIKPANVGLAY
jgi:hypothetical protein